MKNLTLININVSLVVLSYFGIYVYIPSASHSYEYILCFNNNHKNFQDNVDVVKILKDNRNHILN